MSNRLGKNIVLQSAYQILNTCLPLITAPYLSRVLGASQLGVFSYTSSIIAFFALFAMLGTVNYGTRTIALCGNDIDKLSNRFWEIYFLQVISTCFSTIVYIVYLILLCKENTIISALQGITLLGCLINIDWLFFGCERFKITVTRSFVIRIMTVVFILAFVKNTHDLWKYVVIMLSGTVLSNGILWIYVPQLVHIKKVSISQIREHLKPNILLFVPLLAMSVYHIMDRTMMGWLSTYEQSGYYYNADKVINIPLGVLYGFGTVLLPRMTSLFKDNRVKDAYNLLHKSIEGVTLVGIAMTVGIAAISFEFVPIFFGDGYEQCIILIIVLSPVLLIKGLSNTIRTQYLVPLHKEKVFIDSVIVGAVVNLIINFVLIKRIGALGAVIGTLIAEAVSCIWQMVYIKNDCKSRISIRNGLMYILCGTIMYICIRTVSVINLNIVVKILLEIGVGGIVYCGIVFICCKITKNDIYKMILNSFIGRIKK